MSTSVGSFSASATGRSGYTSGSALGASVPGLGSPI